MSGKAVIVGASGLIGRKLLNILLQWPGYDKVIVLARKKLHVKHDNLKQVIVNFDDPESYQEHIKGSALFCCLGTTRNKTPNLANYRHIDHDYPVMFAGIAKMNGMEQYHFVSALGANSRSFNFYTKIKGETEDDLKAIGLDRLDIYRPSLLIGHRSEKRPFEKITAAIMKVIDPLLIGSFKKYRSISAYTVALAMYKRSLIKEDGVFIHPSDKIKHLA